MRAPVRLVVNGTEHRLEVDPERSLLEVLRDVVGLTGTKYGCGEAQCGACTVLLDGAAVRSCVTPVASADGHAVRTVEGLADGEKLHPLQQAFLDEGALQCGYCTPGMLMGACALLDRNREPSRDEIGRALQGHVCRCGCYRRIVAAVAAAAGKQRDGGRK